MVPPRQQVLKVRAPRGVEAEEEEPEIETIVREIYERSANGEGWGAESLADD